MAPARLTTMLLGLFAGLALVMSMSGLAAVMALAVSQRTQELGIRLALGAPRGAVLLLVPGPGLGMTVVGLLLGVLGAVGLTRFLAHWLYATSATDVGTFVLAGVLFLASVEAAYVTGAYGAKQGIAHRVQYHITVGVGQQALLIGYRDATQHAGANPAKLVHVKTMSNSHHA